MPAASLGNRLNSSRRKKKMWAWTDGDAGRFGRLGPGARSTASVHPLVELGGENSTSPDRSDRISGDILSLEHGRHPFGERLGLCAEDCCSGS